MIAPIALLLFTLAAPPGGILADWAENARRSKPDSCPLTILLPLGDKVAAERARYTTEKLADLRCQGVRIQKLRLTVNKGYWKESLGSLLPGDGRHVFIRSDVFLPKGRDLWVTLTYRILAGETALATGSEELEADEGELNWGAGVNLYLEREPNEPVVLEIGLAVEKG